MGSSWQESAGTSIPITHSGNFLVPLSFDWTMVLSMEFSEQELTWWMMVLLTVSVSSSGKTTLESVVHCTVAILNSSVSQGILSKALDILLGQVETWTRLAGANSFCSSRCLWSLKGGRLSKLSPISFSDWDSSDSDLKNSSISLTRSSSTCLCSLNKIEWR